MPHTPGHPHTLISTYAHAHAHAHANTCHAHALKPFITGGDEAKRQRETETDRDVDAYTPLHMHPRLENSASWLILSGTSMVAFCVVKFSDQACDPPGKVEEKKEEKTLVEIVWIWQSFIPLLLRTTYQALDYFRT